MAGQHPDVFEALKSAYLEWYEDIADDHGLEPIPLTLGHPEENPVHLQPHHAIASGKVEFWGNRGLTGERRGTHPRGVDSDWSGNWTTLEDQLSWKVRFIKPGPYKFGVIARDSAASDPVSLRISVDGESVNQQLTTSDLNRKWNYFELGEVMVKTTASTEIALSLTQPLVNNGLEIKELIIEAL
jgi:hypothetical protein